ncbi:MAG: adenosylcobinamide-GDP ribazoletransferase [Methylococcales bacterium]
MPNAKLFLVALSFYTRIPCPSNLDYKQLPQATVFLPLIGWLVGGMIGLSFFVANMLCSQQTALILAFICGIFVTGAFHEDGFADVCDGFGGGYDKQRILDIMKDSQIGVYGAIGLICLFLLKISTVNDLPVFVIPLVLCAGQSISRLPPLYLMYRYDYARVQNSKTIGAVYRPPLKDLMLAGLFALLPLLLLPVWSLLTLAPLVLVNLFLANYFYRHIGGYTGDCLGASQQISEAVFYLSLSALWTFI